MSALTEKVAREHHLVYVPEAMARHCSCGQKPGPYVGGQWHPCHVAQVTEAATRAAVAADIRALEHTREQVQEGVRGGMSVDYYAGWDGAIHEAARIAKERQP